MPGTSLVKFMSHHNGGGRGRLYWNRADVDGAPFRGNGNLPMMYTEEELETRLTPVYDSHVRIFDLSDPDQTAAYREVLDKLANGWATERYVHRAHAVDPKTGNLRTLVHLEWYEKFMEDGQPFHAQRPYLGRLNDD